VPLTLPPLQDNVDDDTSADQGEDSLYPGKEGWSVIVDACPSVGLRARDVGHERERNGNEISSHDAPPCASRSAAAGLLAIPSEATTSGEASLRFCIDSATRKPPTEAGMFSDITYVWRANNALTALGFPINTLPGDFRLRLWALSKQMGLSPKEAACAFVLDLPVRQRPSHAAGLIDRWIIGGDVRPGMIEAAQRAKEEAALALNGGEEKHNVAHSLGEHGEQRETTMFGFRKGSAARLRAEQISVTLSNIKQIIRGKSFDKRCVSDVSTLEIDRRG
jgi:hypothetical protein